MAWIRRYRLRKPLVRRRRGGLRRRMPMMRRIKYNPVPTFTETVALSPLVFNFTSPGVTAGLFQPNFSAIPQNAQYAALYNQYALRRCQLILVPTYNVYDQNLPAGATPVQAPRIVWAIQDSSLVTAPADEDDVLQDNGAKIRMFTKPIKINFRPQACIGNSVNTGGFTATNRKGLTWLTTLNTNIPHNGVSYAITSSLAPAGTPFLANVYMKLTFSLKDPK